MQEKRFRMKINGDFIFLQSTLPLKILKKLLDTFVCALGRMPDKIFSVEFLLLFSLGLLLSRLLIKVDVLINLRDVIFTCCDVTMLLVPVSSPNLPECITGTLFKNLICNNVPLLVYT